MIKDSKDLRSSRRGAELGWTLTASDGSGNRDVCELTSLASTAKQQPASAHVATAHEVAREEKALAEHIEQSIDVLPCRDAAEEHDAGVARLLRCDRVRIASEWGEVALVSAGDVDLAELLEVVAPESGFRRNESAVRRDDEDGRYVGGRRRELARVRELPAEIELAQEAEDFADLGSVRFPQPNGKRELGARVDQHLRPPTIGPGGRQQEHGHDPTIVQVTYEKGANQTGNRLLVRVIGYLNPRDVSLSEMNVPGVQITGNQFQ